MLLPLTVGAAVGVVVGDSSDYGAHPTAAFFDAQTYAPLVYQPKRSAERLVLLARQNQRTKAEAAPVCQTWPRFIQKKSYVGAHPPQYRVHHALGRT